MLCNYLVIAFRNRPEQAVHDLNVVGLAVGIAVAFSILTWIQDELRHDAFHEHADRIYRVLWDGKVGDNAWIIPIVPVPVGAMLAQEFPEVERVANLVNGTHAFRLRDEFVQENRVLFADPEILDLFTFHFVAGNPATALLEYMQKGYAAIHLSGLACFLLTALYV